MTTPRTRRRSAPALVLAGLALALPHAACGGDATAGTTVERTDSAGIGIITSRGPDRMLDWTFQPELAIGGADEGPESFDGVWHGGVAVDDEGRIYLLDSGNHRVSVFGPDGVFIRSMGRQGGGPGELQHPVALALTDDGGVGVFDFGKRGVVRYGPEGEPLDELRVQRQLMGGMAFIDDALVMNSRSIDPEARLDIARLVLDRGSDTTVLARLEKPMGAPAEFSDCPVRISSMEPLFSPGVTWDARDRQIALVAGPGYEIRIHDGADHIRSIRRDVTPRAATRELAVAAVPNGEMRIRFGSGECRIPADEVVEVRGFAPVIPTVERLRLAPDGELWVRRTAPGEDNAPIDVFDAEGEYLGTLPPTTPFPVAFLPDGRLVALESDELDVQRLVVYSYRTGGRG